MESYATKAATVAALISLGFTHVVDEYYDAPNGATQARVYQCSKGYWCVDVFGGFAAPIVWDGPRADWDQSNPLEDFVDWLNEYEPSWRG